MFTEASSSAAVLWPRPRVVAPTHPHPPPAASSANDILTRLSARPRVHGKRRPPRGVPWALVCSGGTSPPPPRSLIRRKHPLKPPGHGIVLNSISRSCPARPHLWSRRPPRPRHPRLTFPHTPPARPRPQRHCQPSPLFTAADSVPVSSADEALSTEVTHPAATP